MKRLWKLLCFIILCLISPQAVCAEEVISEKDPLNVIFIIDGSGSMKTNDRSGMGLDMVQAFIDTVQAEEIRIGYVAYNDGIISYAEPQSLGSAEKREELKQEISSITYSGNTDMGMGVSYGYEMLSAQESSRRIMVLISDGETDLPKSSTRTEEESDQELAWCVSKCREEGIPIYTVAFGQYDGSKAVLEEISAETAAQSYSAQNPENLIEVLYGIFQDNLLYRIQQLANGTYAGGGQDVTCVLDPLYSDEINILLLSSGTVGETTIRYGEMEIEPTNLSHYAVGKISGSEIDNSVKELVIHTVTEGGQDLQIFVVGYRKLTPVLEVPLQAGRNQGLPYQLYYKNRRDEIVTDAGFDGEYFWELSCVDSNGSQGSVETKDTGLLDGSLQGSLRFSHSGTYTLSGVLEDSFGSYSFAAQIEITNTPPYGSIPEEDCTLLERERTICLDDYFKDGDGDELFYAIPDGQADGVGIRLDGNMLTIEPQSAGTNIIMIQVSDGEETISYEYRMKVAPLWQTFWWAIVLVLAALSVILWKLTHKPKPELERLTEEKKQNSFSGKLDAYFVQQPEGEEEIPPLSFQLGRIRDTKVSLGDLLANYPEQAEALQLGSIYLVADEKRRMILYHLSKSGVMVGTNIVCKQLQYSISFGDVIYITSPDGRYDLEIHYIAVYQ